MIMYIYKYKDACSILRSKESSTYSCLPTRSVSSREDAYWILQITSQLSICMQDIIIYLYILFLIYLLLCF